MRTVLFDFFEMVAEELSADKSRIITREDLKIDDEESTLLADMKREMKAASTEEAFQKAVEALREHFKLKGSKLPFDYNSVTGRFTATDDEFLNFINQMSGIRSLGKKSRNFECCVAQRLGKRASGTIHRVGHPRDRKKTKVEFNNYLKSLGFKRPVSLGMDKDGGFDILWLLPIGTIPHKPIVSVQCKNGKFNMGVADTSVGAGTRSLSQHGGLMPSVHVPCVLFNDYIYPEVFNEKQLNFVPLGLTDLATVESMITVDMI